MARITASETSARRTGAWLTAVVAALLLAAIFIPGGAALAYYNYGTVGISVGSSSLSVQAGSTVSTSVAANPSVDQQTRGCGMAKCPQVCATDGAAAGYNCFDYLGNCTCAGAEYSPYYAELSATSSNSGVATAYISGGTLVINGVSAGSATITVNASLRQWTSNSTTVYVEVSAPPSGTSSAGAAGGANNASGGSAASGGASTSAPQAATSTSIPEEAAATTSRDDVLNEEVIETVAGNVYMVENNSHLDTAEEFAKLEGESDQVVIWSGVSAEAPDYSWTFTKDALDMESPFLRFDPTITVSKMGTGSVANIMEQARDGLVLDFAHEGDLPGEASIYVWVGDDYADGTTLKLFCFDDDARAFLLEQEDVEVIGGYASFYLSHCSTWALSTDDLARYEVQEANTPGAIQTAAQEGASEEASENAPVLIAAGIVVAAIVCVLLGAGGLYLRRRHIAQSLIDDEGNRIVKRTHEDDES